MKSQDIVPVLLSIIVIVLVAVFEKQSKLFAALTATMPLATLWLLDRLFCKFWQRGPQFSLSLLLGLLPTFAFLITVWLAARRDEARTNDPDWLWCMGGGATILYLLRNTLGIRYHMRGVFAFLM
jgi:hypothetical protein